jgi:hypothetical protein
MTARAFAARVGWWYGADCWPQASNQHHTTNQREFEEKRVYYVN